MWDWAYGANFHKAGGDRRGGEGVSRRSGKLAPLPSFLLVSLPSFAAPAAPHLPEGFSGLSIWYGKSSNNLATGCVSDCTALLCNEGVLLNIWYILDNPSLNNHSVVLPILELACLSPCPLFGGEGAETPLRFDEQKVSAVHKKVGDTDRDRLTRMSPERKLLKATKTKDTKHLQYKK